MVVKVSIARGKLTADEVDLLARQVEGELSATGGVKFCSEPMKGEPGTRGDPASLTLGTFLLAAITSGTVTTAFNILKSYVERGIDLEFEGVNDRGEPVKLKMKNVDLSKFRSLLSEIGILK